jgi:hypothetical protein
MTSTPAWDYVTMLNLHELDTDAICAEALAS